MTTYKITFEMNGKKLVMNANDKGLLKDPKTSLPISYEELDSIIWHAIIDSESFPFSMQGTSYNDDDYQLTIEEDNTEDN